MSQMALVPKPVLPLPTRLRVFIVLLTACELKPPGGGTDVGPTTTTSSGTGSTPTSSTDGGVTSAVTEIGGPTDDTTESTATAASTTLSSTAEMTFLVMHDLPSGSVPCNPLDETPCPDGQKCSAAGDERVNNLLFVSEPTCFPVLGDKQKGEPCDVGELPVDGLDDCADTLCFIPPWGWFTDPNEPDEPGICVEFCGSGYLPDEPSCADPNDFCFQAGCQECALTLCLPTCDPLAPNCPDGQACLYSGSNREPGFMCVAPYESVPGVGEPCDNSYQCTPDSWCVIVDELAAPCVDGEACCTPLCDLDAPNTCPNAPMGEVCVPFFEIPFDSDEDPWGVKYNRLGYCALL